MPGELGMTPQQPEQNLMAGQRYSVRRTSHLRLTWFSVGLICGLIIGSIIGARYLAWDHNVQIALGTFLPPKKVNWEFPTEGKDALQGTLSANPTKSAVIRKLGLEQVVVLPGSLTPETWRWVLDEMPTKQELDELQKVAEVWLVPGRQTGISDFLYLCFDDSQKLYRWGFSHFMLGFPKNPYHYRKD